MFKIIGVIPIALVAALSCSCKAQEKIVDPVEKIPFGINRKDIYLNIPDTLSKEKVTGVAVLELFVNDAGQMEGFNVIKLLATAKADTLVNFLNISDGALKSSSSYPETVQSYYPLFAEYIKNVTVENRPGVPRAKTNRYSILVRLK